nr:8844_t:CDS:10 [Entrophospora candida]
MYMYNNDGLLLVFTEQPNVNISILPLTNPPAPAVHLAFSQDFTISCSLLYDYDGINSTSCDQYVTQPKNIDFQDFPFVGSFSPKGKINLTRYDDTENEYVYDTQHKYFDPSLPPYEESLFYMNKYTLTGNHLFKLGYSRKTRKMLITTPLNYVGIPPQNYFTQNYIESTIQDIPAQPSNTAFLTVRISPHNFITEEEQEQRHSTLITALGTIAAYYSSIVFIYVFLFGVESMKPWGFVHNGCCGFRKETKDSLIPILEFGSKNQLKSSKNSTVPETHRALRSSIATEMLSERIRELESFRIFLEDFVVDTSLLESVKKEQKKRQQREV